MIVKKIFIILLFIILICMFPKSVNASNTLIGNTALNNSGGVVSNSGRETTNFWSDLFEYANNFIEEGKDNGQQVESAKVKEISDSIFYILLGLGIVFSVVVGGIIGIKFMIASAADKAKLKEALVPYVAGCIVIFGASGIWKLCITILSNI